MAERAASPGEHPGRNGGTLPASVSLEAVSCPRCAGSMAATLGSPVLSCCHCGTNFLQVATDGYTRRYFPCRVARLSAIGTAGRWLLAHPDAPDDIRDMAFSEAHLLYVPLWEVRAHVVGWEFGKRVRTKREVRRVGDQEVVELNLVEEGVEAGFLDERRLYREAVDLGSLGVNRPHVSGRDFTLPLVPGALEEGAAVLEAESDLAAVIDQARASFLRPPTGTLSRDTRLFLLRENAALIYYPLWHLRYRYRGRSYEVMVDGRNGEVHAARAPADNRRRLAVMIASYAGLALAAGLLTTAWRDWGLPETIAFYCAVLLLVLAATVYWRFELIREVEHHERFSS